VGTNTYIASTNAVALGADASVAANSSGGMALGQGSSVRSNATGGVAIGQGAAVLPGAANSVALGAGSVASEPNTVSVGAPGAERRITNLAPGINGTDAANMDQLNAVDAKTKVNSQNIAANRAVIEQHETRLAQDRVDIDHNAANIDSLGRGLDDLRRESRSGIAAASALVTLMPSAPGKTMFNLGGATFQGETAVGLTAVHRIKSERPLYFNAGMSLAGQEALMRVGGSIEF
jgi:autotransporter adhesin